MPVLSIVFFLWMGGPDFDDVRIAAVAIAIAHKSQRTSTPLARHPPASIDRPRTNHPCFTHYTQEIERVDRIQFNAGRRPVGLSRSIYRSIDPSPDQ